MTTRRDALITLAGGTASTALARALESDAPMAHHMQETAAEPASSKVPKPPTYFHARDYDTLTRLVDLILPRTNTPGAVDAQVQWRIDQQVSQTPKLQSLFTHGIAHLNQAAAKEGKTDFLALTEMEQVSLMKALSDKNTPESEFFENLKALTLNWYYRSYEGLVQELGYKGNTYRASFPGCTHPDHWPSAS